MYRAGGVWRCILLLDHHIKQKGSTAAVNDDALFKYRLGAFALARELGNVRLVSSAFFGLPRGARGKSLPGYTCSDAKGYLRQMRKHILQPQVPIRTCPCGIWLRAARLSPNGNLPYHAGPVVGRISSQLLERITYRAGRVEAEADLETGSVPDELLDREKPFTPPVHRKSKCRDQGLDVSILTAMGVSVVASTIRNPIRQRSLLKQFSSCRDWIRSAGMTSGRPAARASSADLF